MLLAAAICVALRSPGFATPPGGRSEIGGWIQITLQGSPHDVGFQHGSLLSSEIRDFLAISKLEHSGWGHKWDWFRDTAQQLFWEKLDPEYQQEIEGITDGARSKGVSLDQWDILALNAQIELMGYDPSDVASAASWNRPLSCSAFVATGSYTKDGNVVAAHNFWWDPLTGLRWRIVADVRPNHGHRFEMDTAPGLIDSATDWAQNDAGLVLCETTISNFRGFDPLAKPEFQRMRKAIQYGESLSQMAAILLDGNNGGYANTWLMADRNTKEVGMLELGLNNVVFRKTKDGAYYGANFPADPGLLTDECKGYDPKWSGGCEERRARWKQLIETNKGRIDVAMARAFLGDHEDSTGHELKPRDDRAICGGSLNAKATDATLISQMRFWARLGASDGTPLMHNADDVPATFKPYLMSAPTRPWVIVCDPSGKATGSRAETRDPAGG